MRQTSYDEIPYPSLPRPHTHPAHIAARAVLFGMEPAPVQRCRVLEIGCADGSNIIPMAYQLPDSEFLGLDLSSRQITAGQARAKALGLKNLTLTCMNLLDVGPELGQFDYIIAHGVYSWVSSDIQRKLLEICRQHLSPQGVAYISFNVYPGWYMHAQVRHLMLYYSRGLASPYDRIKKGRALLDLFLQITPTLSSTLPEALEINHLILKSMQQLLQDQPDEYLVHDHLEAHNEPLYLYQFVERIESYGLQYLADAESSALITQYLPAHITRALQDAGIASDQVELEQVMDFLYLRAFRQALVCRQEVNLQRAAAPERLMNLYVSASIRPAGPNLDIHAVDMVAFQSPQGTTLSTRQPINKAALLYLSDIWPQSIPFQKLLARANARLRPDAPSLFSAAGYANAVKTVGAMLLKGFALGIVELYTHPFPFTLTSGNYPRVSNLVRLDAQRGKQVVNQRHEPVLLDDEPAYYLLPYLDGQHSRDDLLARMMDLIIRGDLFTPSPAPDPEQLRQILADSLQYSLNQLARKALLID